MGEQRDYRGPQSPKQCMECCEAECREQCRQKCCCPPPPQDCPPRPCQNACNEGGGSGIWLILLLIVLYPIFCNDNNGRGGLFGGLF